MYIYRLRADSPAALVAILEAAGGGTRPLVTRDETGAPLIDGARVVYPYPELKPGEPVIDAETGATLTPQEPTGYWLCEVRLIEPNALLPVTS